MKFVDCALSVLKTVFLVKNKFLISSILNSISAVMFVMVADTMANADSSIKMWIAGTVFLANLAGGYIPPKLVDRLEKDRLFVYVITAPTLEEGISLADNLRHHGIPVTTSVEYRGKKDVSKSLEVKAFASTKEESKIIGKHLSNKYKWHVVEAI